MTEQNNQATTATADAHALDGTDADEGQHFSLADLLGGMSMEPPTPPLDPAQARGILRTGFATLTKEHTFEPGDFIQRKDGLYSGNSDLRGGVAVFVRYAVPEPHTFDTPNPGAPVPIVDEDCIIAIVLPSDEVGEYFACARYFEPAPTVAAVA